MKKKRPFKTPMKTSAKHFQTSSRGRHPSFAAGASLGNNQSPDVATAAQGDCVGHDYDASDIEGGAMGGG